MASNINPNSIDAAYPVAGQDNSTQGFRTNFANIKQNFEYAEQEINALQTYAILTNSSSTNFNNNTLYAVRLQDAAVARDTKSAAAGAITIDFATAQYYSLVTDGSISLTFTNWPGTSESAVGSIRIQIEVTDPAHTLTFAANTGGSLINAGQIQGYSSINSYTGIIKFPEIGYYEFEFTSYTAGAEISVQQIDHTVLNSSSEDLASASSANLAVTTSYFSTAAAETATLAAGVNGQEKVFAMVADSGDMVITVANAGWKSSGTGTITFDAVGDSCTLKYIVGDLIPAANIASGSTYYIQSIGTTDFTLLGAASNTYGLLFTASANGNVNSGTGYVSTLSKWFCIGNNGCVFA